MQNQPPTKPRLVPASRDAVESESDAEDAAQNGGAARWGEAPLHGQSLGHYTLIRQLRQSGYASVYLGVHHYLNSYVALKLMN